jgi:predicted Fe-Mo cluster-binding NifX family protein
MAERLSMARWTTIVLGLDCISRYRRGQSLSRAKKKRKEKLRIAVTAEGKELSSEIDLRFGRAKFLLVVDTESGDFVVHDNQLNLNAVQGAGIQTGQNIANLGVEAVITGNVGPNAFKTLNAAGVKIFLAEKQTVAEAVESFKADNLKEVDQANVEGHWI